MHRGVCVGGPLAGQTIETRSEFGFVAVDRPGNAAWLYFADEAGRFVPAPGCGTWHAPTPPAPRSAWT
jgi:hypothetical protein